MDFYLEPKGKAKRCPPRGWDEGDYLRETKKQTEKAQDDADFVLGKGMRLIRGSIMRKRIWPPPDSGSGSDSGSG